MEYIEIIGQTIHGKLGDRVSNHLFYEYLDDKTRLTEREQELLLHGLKWASPFIEKNIKQDITIHITHLSFNVCDYQPEGLFYAIAHWASKHFDFELPSYSFSFHKKQNKYNFPDLNTNI